MNLPEKNWRELYIFAIKYARVCRSYCVEVDEAVNEMMLVVLRMQEWKSEEYAKQMMRNRIMDIFRHETAVHKWERPLEEGVEMCREESDKWDAKIMVDDLMKRVSASHARTLKCLLNGRTINETAGIERMTRRTVHRRIAEARELLKV
jgi:DNA-directed RNA polymerase specialized sigma24 family protein